MKIDFFGTEPYDRASFDTANEEHQHEIRYLDAHLDQHTPQLLENARAVCVFVNDVLDATVLKALSERGIKLIALRCAGWNNVDLKTAESLGLTVVRVPAYSPHAVAEHALALILALNRKTHRAYNRVREGNFALDGLMGQDIYGKTAGVVGTGKIGINLVRILKGFGCRVLAYDPNPSEEATRQGAEYTELTTLLSESDIISLHCPLTPDTHYLIDDEAIKQMKQGITLINTSRGGLVDTQAVIRGLKSGTIGELGLDVYEEEGDLFFEDLSGKVIQDDVFARLITFPNVLITGHQAFFTKEALNNIAKTTLNNITEFEKTGECSNTVERPA